MSLFISASEVALAQEHTAHVLHDVDRDASWLLCRAKQIVGQAKRLATDGTEIWSPAGLPDFYNSSMYPRDFYYTVDACPECFSDTQLRKAITWLLARNALDGQSPNSVGTDGKPWFWLRDNCQFMVNLVHLYVLRTGEDAFFKKHASALEKSMAWLPRNPETHLVTTSKPDSMYGFNDAFHVLGDDLVTSLLYFEAAHKLQELYTRIGDSRLADYWKNQAALVKQGLQTLYDKQGFFYACSEGPNRQPLVTGSAFAVYIGVTNPQQNRDIGNWLCRNFDGCILAGQVRHTIKPLTWHGVTYGENVYQNGGYWATPFAWVNRAIRNVDSALADRMLLDILVDFQKHGINEVVNYEVDYVNRSGHAGEYSASLAPLITLRELGAKFNSKYMNVALATNGAFANASSVYDNGREPKHQIDHLCDGHFGNSHSWIPSPSDTTPWFQIELSGPARIDLIVLGRDNWAAGLLKNQHKAPNRTGFDNRDIKEIKILVSSDGETWSKPVYSNHEFPDLQAGENFVIKLDKAVTCQFVKVELLPFRACIDEFEVFGTFLDSSHSKANQLDRDIAWLSKKTKRMIRASKRTMSNGVAAFSPQVGSHYPAFWLRDYAYMLEGCADVFSDEELLDAAQIFVGGQREDGACVDCIKFDGTPIYKPGFGSMGIHPVADGSQFTVDIVWHAFERTKDLAFLGSVIDKLQKAMEAVPRNEHNGLVHIKPGEPQDRCPYGFTDTIPKQGDVLFCSLLYVQASREMADLYLALNRPRDSKRWGDEALRVAASIRKVFWCSDENLFHAATVKCNQLDIWGSAFAVYLGVADGEQSKGVAKFFKDHYDSIVQCGQIRHLPAGVSWEGVKTKDRYQTGAFWGTPTGWFVYTLNLIDSELADRTIFDLVQDYQRRGVQEWVFAHHGGAPDYNASGALPLAGIRKMLEYRKQNAKKESESPF